MRKLEDILGQKGSMMVEALAMLGLISMVTPVLYKKAAERTSELQDINTASQFRTLSKAMDDMIKDNYSELSTGDVDSGVFEIDKITDRNNNEIFDENSLNNYLPAGFNVERTKLLNDYNFRIIRNVAEIGTDAAGNPINHVSLTGVVSAEFSPDQYQNGYPNARASKIASMIGANGGVFNRAGVDNDIHGVQGGWTIPAADLGIGDNAAGIAATSVHAINASSGVGDDHVLFRDDSKGDIQFNTMSTTLYMGGEDFADVHRIIANADDGNEILIGAGDDGADAASLLVNGVAEISHAGSEGYFRVDDSSSVLRFTNTNVLEMDNVGSKLQGGTASNYLSLTNSGETTLSAADDNTIVLNNQEEGSDGGIAIKGNGHVTAQASDNSKLELETDKAVLQMSDNTKLNLTAGEALLQKGDSGKLSITDDNINLQKGENTQLSMSDSQVMLKKGDNSRVRLRDNLLELWENSRNYIQLRNSQPDDPSKAQLQMASANVSVISKETTISGQDSVTLTSGDSGLKLTPDAIDLSNGEAFLNLDHNSGEAMIGNRSGGTINSYVMAGPSSIKAELGNTNLTLNNSGGKIATTGENGKSFGLNTTGTSAYLYGNSGSPHGMNSYVTAYGDRAQMSVYVRGNKSATFKLEGHPSGNMGEIEAEADQIKLGANETIFYRYSDGVPSHTADVSNTHTSDGVLINHQGMIALPTENTNTLANTEGKQSIKGYIRADRLLGNVAYEKPWTTGNYNPTDPYDAYQVNPAYTSVMHDIKLATRGGARLSDILPDFINKGIYVIDNSYVEPPVKDDEKYKTHPKQKQCNLKNDWSTYTDPLSSSFKEDAAKCECDSDDPKCPTTPWLGFVPAPQCPPGYAKVITINPIRWKMSEAYSISDTTPDTGSTFDRFDAYFIRPTNPKQANLVLEETVAPTDGTTGHTHEFDRTRGWPLTFQTNTWLNTTISGVRNSNHFLGWHAIMGFLYYGSDYKDYLTTIGSSGHENKVIWNIFPVFNQEMTAIATVYCYFERRPYTSGSGGNHSGNDNGNWIWDPNIVDTSYDQLENFREGYTKEQYKSGPNYGGNYVGRLNDPSLDYNDPW